MSKSQYKCQRPRSIAGPLDNRHSTCKTRLVMAKEAMAKEAQVQGHMVMEAMAQAKICKAMAKEALVQGPGMEAMAQASLPQRHKRPDLEFRMGCHLGSRVYIRLRPSLYPMNS